MAISTYLLVIALNENGQNSPTKRNRVDEWMKKKQKQKYDPSICCLQEIHFRHKDTHRQKLKEWEKIFHVNGNQKKARLALLISYKIDFETKTLIRDKEGHYIMIKGSI